MVNRLYSKSYTTTEVLARYFLALDVGERINTISEFLDILDVARGTVQNSLQILKDSRAIALSSHGKLGTYLERKNNQSLLKFANIPFIMGVMPLPYSRLYEGLSTGIIQEMSTQMKIPVNMAYMRGAQRRLDLVADGRYDFAVVSKFAADEYMHHYPNTIDIAIDFGEQSYLMGHVLILADPEKKGIEDGMRVAIDYDSIDQTKLTLQACENKQITLVPLGYSQFSSSLLNHDIDAAIWNADEINRSLLGLKTVPIELNTHDNTTAVLIISKERTDIKNLIDESLSLNEVLKIQKEVCQGIRIPEY